MVHDSYFETVHSDPNDQPEVWEDLVLLQSFKSNYDCDQEDQEHIPPLGDEWLSPEEHIVCQREQTSAKPSGRKDVQKHKSYEHDDEKKVH